MTNKSLRYQLNVLGLSILTFLALRELFGLVFAFMGLNTYPVVWICVNMVSFVVSCLAPIILIENLTGRHPKIFLKKSLSLNIYLAFWSYLLIVIASIVNSLFIKVIQWLGVQLPRPSITIPEKGIVLVLYFIFLCVMPALLEEIFIRGYVLNVLRPYGQTFAIVVSALFFTLMHAQLSNILIIFVCGFLLGCLYCQTESIWPCVLLHFINNTISFIVTYAQSYMNGVSAFSLVIYLNILIVLLGLLSKKQLIKRKINIGSVVWKDEKLAKKLGMIFKSPMAMLAMAILIALTLEQVIRG